MKYTIKTVLILAAFSGAAYAVDAEKPTEDKKRSQEDPSIKLEEIEVTAPRVVPDIGVTQEETVSNIKSKTAKEIERAQPTSLSEYLGDRMQSVNVNDYGGNVFQMDVNFRGFSASPLLGTAQGMSVYLDGARMNDPFGDTVSWDTFPMNAIERLDLVPGSNPLFGLNTIGGAITMRTKSGFSRDTNQVKATAGSWGRKQVQMSVGGAANEHLAAFLAVNRFDEDGWRQLTPSQVRQAFLKLEGRVGNIDTSLSVLNADNSLFGNGLTPLSMLQEDRANIFTAPDITNNKTNHYNFSGSWQVTDAHRFELMTFKRKTLRNTENGDWNDDFNDSDYDGKKGGFGDPGGLVAGAPIALINKTKSDLTAEGTVFSYRFEGEKHNFLLGLSKDKKEVKYQSSSRLATLDADRVVQITALPDYPVNSGGDILINRLRGDEDIKAAFFSETYSPTRDLHFTLSGRWTRATVSNNLISSRNGLSSADDSIFYRPEQFESFDYKSFTPSIGGSWSVTPRLNVFGSVSRGNRLPSALELACANPNAPCRVPSALTDDPYLKQVMSTTTEIGARGSWGKKSTWNVAVFNTDLKNDILFVGSPVSNQMGYFTNFGETRRQGIELGTSFVQEKFKFDINYTYLLATYQTAARLRNNANSTSQFDVSNQGKLSERFSYQVEPGDQLPGVPNHQLKLGLEYYFTPKFDMDINANIFSSAYVRGNENNEHEAGTVVSVVDNAGTTESRTFLNSGKIPGYAVFHLQARYKPRKDITLFIKVNNVFDRAYYTAGSLVTNPFVASGSAPGNLGVSGFNHNSSNWERVTAYAPGAPRAAWVGVGWDF